MTRRQMLAIAGAWAASGEPRPEAEPDIRLRIAPLTLELAPKRTVKTLAYNGQVPGPLLRFKEGTLLTVEVSNETNNHELVHWHGFHIPSDVDGAHEEGTPPIPAQSTSRYSFKVQPSGTRWYHSHGMSGRDFQKSTYTGQFGMFIVEPRQDPGRYDVEVPILLHDWEPSLVNDEIDYKLFSINGKILGAGEPIRVKQAQRVLFRMVNASATMTHQLALPAHTFHVIALDGNPVSNPRDIAAIELAPGERADVVVNMNSPGVWVLGEARDQQRKAGMGVVIEYAGHEGPARWIPVPSVNWDYTAFGGAESPPQPDGRFLMLFKEHGNHHWTINGKSFPHTDPLIVQAGRRYRLSFDNQSALAHPIHLHRHTFEITRFVDRPTSGVWKDVVVVPAWRKVDVDLIASNPGPSLFHCHHQFHMDMGLMTLMQYAD